MAKSNSQRFNEALKTLVDLGASKNQAIFKGYLGVLQWLDAQGNRNATINSIGGMISLGNYSGNSPQLKAHRKAVRAYLLLMATRYAKTKSELSTLGTKYKNYTGPVDTNKVIQELVKKSQSIVVSTAGIVVAPEVSEKASAEFNVPNITLVLRTGRDKARDIVQQALAHLSSKRGRSQVSNMVRYSG